MCGLMLVCPGDLKNGVLKLFLSNTALFGTSPASVFFLFFPLGLKGLLYRPRENFDL